MKKNLTFQKQRINIKSLYPRRVRLRLTNKFFFLKKYFYFLPKFKNFFLKFKKYCYFINNNFFKFLFYINWNKFFSFKYYGIYFEDPNILKLKYTPLLEKNNNIIGDTQKLFFIKKNLFYYLQFFFLKKITYIQINQFFLLNSYYKFFLVYYKLLILILLNLIFKKKRNIVDYEYLFLPGSFIKIPNYLQKKLTKIDKIYCLKKMNLHKITHRENNKILVNNQTCVIIPNKIIKNINNEFKEINLDSYKNFKKENFKKENLESNYY